MGFCLLAWRRDARQGRRVKVRATPFPGDARRGETDGRRELNTMRQAGCQEAIGMGYATRHMA